MTDVRRVTANGLTFEYRHAGDPDGRLALCLHGFPDDAGTFDPLLNRLADAGYHAVAPYMRGYGPTDRAPDGDYSALALGRDALALVSELDGTDETVLLGHDWGAAACYVAAALDPSAVGSLVTLAVPPNFGHRLREHPRQWLRSWYMAAFQFPGSERLLRMADYALVEFLWSTWSPGWDYPEARLDAVRDTLRTPGSTTAALEYYRQSPPFRAGGPPARFDTSALVLHGADDGCIGPELFAGAGEAFTGERRVARVREAGHFLHRERPDVVAAEVLDWLA
ncbi:alpha/beta fold hydrolase [Halomarina litorea]|uniref:alpha/beta fold hydrolase n=1 Tax=Halomarina litorea TaxID=2961595 RepID=UPI0020C23A87|nr:alpha/beta hydrolase [Halomarina sp. BCD28]